MDMPSIEDEDGQDGDAAEYSENRRYARSNVVLGRGAFKTGAGRACMSPEARPPPKLHLWCSPALRPRSTFAVRKNSLRGPLRAPPQLPSNLAFLSGAYSASTSNGPRARR